jgi:hypothetical protein
MKLLPKVLKKVICNIEKRNYRWRRISKVIKEADAHERVFASRTKTTAGETVDARKLARLRDSSR